MTTTFEYKGRKVEIFRAAIGHARLGPSTWFCHNLQLPFRHHRTKQAAIDAAKQLIDVETK